MPRLRNTAESYGWIAIALHWLLAVLIIGLFALGLWMRGLGYYDPWYYRATELHVSFGLVVALLLAGRLLWRLVDGNPRPLAHHGPWLRRASITVHHLLYALGFAIIISGILVAVAGDDRLRFFFVLDLGSSPDLMPDQADRSGAWHEWLAWTLMAFVALHSLAALKHHFIDRDTTLRRMLSPGNRRE